MRIIVIGVGAIGGYFGARLQEAGNEVAFLARGRTLVALRDTELRVESPLGDVHLNQVEVSDDPAALPPGDVVIAAVKAWQIPGIASSIGQLLRPGGCVLPLQNGIDAPVHLAAELGAEATLGGLCKIICKATAPARIRHLGADPYVALGELDDRLSDRTTELRATLAEAGFTAEIPASIQSAMWEKFLFICAMSGLAAATRVTLGELRSQPETRVLLRRSMVEIRAVAEAKGIALSSEIVDQMMDFVDSLPESATASMQRDIMAGRPSELESQNGAVVRHGREAGVATPIHETLYHLLLPMERAARSD